MTIRLSRSAVADLREARDHHDEIGPRLGVAFADAVDAVVDRIEMFPRGAPPVEGFPELRRARVRGFPYGAFYRIQPGEADDVVEVVRVLHSARGDSFEHMF